MTTDTADWEATERGATEPMRAERRAGPGVSGCAIGGGALRIMRGSGVYQTRQGECTEQSRELWEGLVAMVPERVRVTAQRVGRLDSATGTSGKVDRGSAQPVLHGAERRPAYCLLSLRPSPTRKVTSEPTFSLLYSEMRKYFLTQPACRDVEGWVWIA